MKMMLYLIVNTAMYSMKYGIVMYEVQYNPLSAPWQSLYGIVKYEVQYNPLSLTTASTTRRARSHTV